MSEAGLNGLDMQAVFAAWIIANDGCAQSHEISCSGEGGYFKGTECPMLDCYGLCSAGCLDSVRQWLEKYHQQKAEAAEAEKRKAETAKKEEPRKICGTCRHVPVNIIDLGDVQRTVQCEKKGVNVPSYLEGCPDFELRAATNQPSYVFAKNSMDTSAYAEYDVEPEPSDSVPFRAAFFDVLKENRTLRSRLNKTAAEYSDLATGALATKSKLNRHEEMVFQLKKLNARLRYRIHVYKEKLKSAKELCESGQRLVKKDMDDLTAKYELLAEQRNKLSNDLIQATRMVKEADKQRNDRLSMIIAGCESIHDDLRIEAEREAGQVKKELAAYLRRCNEMHLKIIQLEEENAKLRSELEQTLKEKNTLQGQCECLYLHNKKAKDEVSRLAKESARLEEENAKLQNLKHSTCRGIEEGLCRINELEKESADLRNGNKALSITIVQMSGIIKHLEEQLSDSEGNHLYTANLYAYKPTAEEFLVMKGLYRQK